MGATDGANGIINQGAKLEDVTKDIGKTLNINVGWTFTAGRPSGRYALQIKGQPENISGKFSNGELRITGLTSLCGEGALTIELVDSAGKATGPGYCSKVILGELPKIQTAAGLARRLTNLGFYAGTDGECNGRMAWAIRAFKRMNMNAFTRNKNEVENNTATKAFLEAVQTLYGAQPDDQINSNLSLAVSNASIDYCGMFGSCVYRRGSFEEQGAPDDFDPDPQGTGIWEGESAGEVTKEPIAGNYALYLRAFDSAKENPFSNRINLPQSICMAQFVLFELGYWLVWGEKDGLVKEENTWIRKKFIPDGWLGRYTQWAVREFQCYAKFDYAAKEDVTSTEKQFLPRVFRATGDNPVRLIGNARYPNDGEVNGKLNEETRKALQAWADGALRCPVFVCASKIYNSK
jgi:hypothetical protein